VQQDLLLRLLFVQKVEKVAAVEKGVGEHASGQHQQQQQQAVVRCCHCPH
jgi:hypothetical protein